MRAPTTLPQTINLSELHGYFSQYYPIIMEKLDAILDGFTDPATGSLHGAVFIAVDRSGGYLYYHLFNFYEI